MAMTQISPSPNLRSSHLGGREETDGVGEEIDGVGEETYGVGEEVRIRRTVTPHHLREGAMIHIS